jgi:glycosyltransferase involved in cell wall biosynthesis
VSGERQNDPEVTVVVPTHNRRDIIGPTLLGALNQEDVEIEVVVVDDCSADGTVEKLRELDEPRLRVIAFETNKRQAAARNAGIAEARGRWIAFLDDDDVWSPRKTREQVDAAERSGAASAYSIALVLDAGLDPTRIFYPPPAESQPDSILASSSVPAGSSNLIVRADLLRSIGGVDEELEALADWDLFIRVLLNDPTAAVEEPHVGYVLRPGSMSAGAVRRHFSDLDRIVETYRFEREQRGVELDGVQFSRWLAGGLRRGGNRRGALRTYLEGAKRYRSPGNVLRAAGLLAGERTLAALSGPPALPEWADQPWLDLYRPGGRFDHSLDELSAGRDSAGGS